MSEVVTYYPENIPAVLIYDVQMTYTGKVWVTHQVRGPYYVPIDSEAWEDIPVFPNDWFESPIYVMSWRMIYTTDGWETVATTGNFDAANWY